MKKIKTSDILKPLNECSYQAFISNTLQFADILDWILSQVGRSEVWISSFSISEEFLRRLFFIKNTGNIKDISLILDFKATQKTMKLWVFIQEVINSTYLSNNHSKIMLIRSDSGQTVSVITSQNLTRGNRFESASISTDNSTFYLLLSHFLELVKTNSIPLNELLRESINAN